MISPCDAPIKELDVKHDEAATMNTVECAGILYIALTS